MASYATPADLLKRYDARDIGDLASDTGTQVSAGSIPTDPNVLAALADASGDIDSALMAGNRYTSADLTSLAGNTASKLIRLTCDIAMGYLLARRPGFDMDRLKQFREQNHFMLERLRKGENVFDLAPQKEAGVIDHATPSAVDTSKLQLMRDRTKNYYPARRFPTN